jgi:hypothetical protein
MFSVITNLAYSGWDFRILCSNVLLLPSLGDLQKVVRCGPGSHHLPIRFPLYHCCGTHTFPTLSSLRLNRIMQTYFITTTNLPQISNWCKHTSVRFTGLQLIL